MSRWLCKCGLHDWAVREVHVTSKQTDKFTTNTAILDRCSRCGTARIAPFGGAKPTQFIVPEKYAQQDQTP